MTPDAIEFGLGGSNKNFVAVLNDTEKKAKETADKVKKEFDKAGEGGLKGKSRIKEDLNSISGDLVKATTAGGALDAVMMRVGKGLGMAGAATAVVGIAKSIYDATQEATEFWTLWQKIENSGRGGVGNFGLDQLQANLETIMEAEKANMDRQKDWLAAYGSKIQDIFAQVGNSTLGKWTGTEVETMTTEERADRLRKAREEALNRIAEKEREIWQITDARVKGSKNEAEIMAIKAHYAERIQAAVENPEMVAQLNIERDATIAEAYRMQAQHRRALSLRSGGLAARVGDSERALTMSSEDEERQTRGSAAMQAVLEADEAKRLSAEKPGDEDLQAASRMAQSQSEQIAADNAKWERDIARSKGDAVKSAKAGNEAMEAQLRGQSFLAESIRKRAANELAIVQAQRAGNNELAAQLRITGELEQKELMRRRVMDGDRVMRLSEVRSRERREQVNADIADRAARRLEEGGSRVKASVGRSPRRSRIGGAIFDADDFSSRIEAHATDPGDFFSQFQQRGIDDMRSRSGSVATAEMNHKIRIADAGMTRAARRDAIEKNTLIDIQSGKADPGKAMATVAQILEKWDRE